MRKTYMSLAVSRAWSADMPIGDPFGGPAYGERNMPLVAVVAAVGAASTIATVGIAAMSALQVIAAVGAITAGIGVVTGNEKLTKIGSIMGLAGGIGAFAQSQGWLGAEAGMSATEAATSAGTQGAQAAQVTEAAGANVAELAQGGADVGKALESAAPATGVEQVVETAQGGLMAPPAETALQPATTAPGAMPSAPAATGSINTAAELQNWDRSNLPIGNSTAASTSWLDNFKGVGKFMDDNKMLTSIGSSAIGGMFDEEKEAKANAYGAQADMLRQQMDNMTRMPTARLMQPTNPSLAINQKTGLMRPKGA
jgi:hypothetical protein